MTGMDWAEVDSRTCSIAKTLELVGERWSLLVLRDVFNGVRRFDTMQRHLGVARNILSQRLAALTESGLLTKVPYQRPGSRPRAEYRLTERGRDLYPVLMALVAWGDRHLAGPAGPPARTEHVDCGATVRLVPVCESGHHITRAAEVRVVPGPGAVRRETA
jgi:DNA-binding HxlR family transcriptional regulator